MPGSFPADPIQKGKALGTRLAARPVIIRSRGGGGSHVEEAGGSQVQLLKSRLLNFRRIHSELHSELFGTKCFLCLLKDHVAVTQYTSRCAPVSAPVSSKSLTDFSICSILGLENNATKSSVS